MVDWLPTLINVIGFGMLAAGAMTLPMIGRMIVEKMYPIPLILLSNSGGAHDTKSVMLHPKIFMRARWVQTPFGLRFKIWRKKQTYPSQILSKERAIPYRGGTAYILYEKEVNQFFPVHMTLFTDKGSPEKRKKVKDIYDSLINADPGLAEVLSLSNTVKDYSPVNFANADIKLQPFPLDAITPYTYDMKARQQRVMRQSKWAQIAPMLGLALVVIAFVIGMVLYFEFVKDSMAANTASVQASEKNIAEAISGFIEGGGKTAETPPGGVG